MTGPPNNNLNPINIMSLLSTLLPNLASRPARENPGTAEVIAPVVRPLYEIKKSDDTFGLTVRLPGVAREGLEITAENNRLKIVGKRSWKQPEGWTAQYRETSDAAYELVLEHDNAVDLEKIHAELKDGILRVSLPKAEALKPRKITVT